METVYEFRLPRGPRKREYVVVPLSIAVYLVVLAKVEPNLVDLPRWELWVSLPATAGLALIHEVGHLAVQRRAGARPRLGFRLRSARAYTLSEGFRFSRGWWIASLLTPLATTVPAAIVLVILMLRPWTVWLAVMAPIGCAADVEFVVRTMRRATRYDIIEDRPHGFAVVRPS